MFKLGKEWLSERDLPRIRQEMDNHLRSHCRQCGTTGQLIQVEGQVGLYCPSCAAGVASLASPQYEVVTENPSTDTQINEENTSKVDN